MAEIKEETVVNILKCLFMRVGNKKGSRGDDDYDEGIDCGKGINFLLEIGRNDVKYKVLTTLILVMKNLENLKII